MLVVAPRGRPGQPAYERVKAFMNFFEQEDIHCRLCSAPTSLSELCALILTIYKEGWRNIFVTMPPFRNWSLCFLPRINTILDLRDGWSIAMRTGYGGVTAPNRFKAAIARAIEQLAIQLSTLTITCTPGLMRYHSTVRNEGKLLLIPNGFPSDEFSLVEKLRRETPDAPRLDEVRFICAGKFSEYGLSKAKDIIISISNKFSQERCAIYVYSNNKSENFWVDDFLREKKINNINFINMNNVSRPEILKSIIESDYGIAFVRNESYEFGTKIFDYAVCRTPIYDFFEDGDIKNFFKGFFDTDFIEDQDVSKFSRDVMIRNSDWSSLLISENDRAKA